MRIALISDVHANLQAWQAVSRDIRNHGPDMTICLGDPVGYGPDPQAVLDGVREVCAGAVIGDHDAVISGILEREVFDEESLRLIDWTAEQLDGEAISHLRSLPYKMGDDDLVCVHAEPRNPDCFGFILDKPDALEALEAARQPLVFVGHTHVAGAFEMTTGKSIQWRAPGEFKLKPNTRYVINPGSVGDPLDTSPRASYCLFDTETRDVTFRRIPFAYENYRIAIEKARTGITPRCLSLINAKFTADASKKSVEDSPPQPHDGRTGLLKRIPARDKPRPNTATNTKIKKIPPKRRTPKKPS
jgi:predicted phosphodiesterase